MPRNRDALKDGLVFADLSKREMEVLQLHLEGLSEEKIADVVGIGPNAVHRYLHKENFRAAKDALLKERMQDLASSRPKLVKHLVDMGNDLSRSDQIRIKAIQAALENLQPASERASVSDAEDFMKLALERIERAVREQKRPSEIVIRTPDLAAAKQPFTVAEAPPTVVDEAQDDENDEYTN